MPRTKKQAAHWDVAEFLILHDISLWTTTLTRGELFQAELHEGKMAVQSKKAVHVENFLATFVGMEEEQHVLRVMVDLGVRSVCKDSPDQMLYSLEATFSCEFFVKQAPPSQEEFSAFVEKNCPHLAWPFWRQHVYDTLKRASLPVPLIPLLASPRMGLRPRRRAMRSIRQAED